MRRLLYVLPLFALLISMGVGFLGPASIPKVAADPTISCKAPATSVSPGNGDPSYCTCPKGSVVDATADPNTCVKNCPSGTVVVTQHNQKYCNEQLQCPDGTNAPNNNVNQCPDPTTTTTADATDPNASSPTVSCGGFSLTWLVCPVIELLKAGVSAVDNIINNLLEVNTSSIFSNCPKNSTSADCKTSAAYKTAWASMRTIALALLVIAALVMVIAQATGSSVVDAYTVKKVMPRLITAAIAITLSWQLLQLFVTFTNDLGDGIRALIYSPFSGLSHTITPGGWTGGLGGTILLGTGFALLAAGGLLSFLGTALLAVLLAVMVLIIRQVLVVFLILIAPIALAAYILPNTKKMFDLWWDFFAKALLMFPFIAAFIATGRVFAQVAETQAQAGASGTATTQIYSILAFVSYFAPYFLLPLTFRFAGGALGTIGGFVNDRGKGGFDRLRNYRANKAKQNWSAIQDNRRFNPNAGGLLGRVNRRANTMLSAASDPVSSAKIYGGGALRRLGWENQSIGKGVLNQIEEKKYDHSEKLAQKMNKVFNDRALSQLTGMDSFSAGDIRRAADDLEARGRANNDGNSLLAAQQLRANATWLSTDLHNDQEMGRADIGVAAALANSAQGFGGSNEVATLANSDRIKSSPGLRNMLVSNAQLNGQRAGRLDMSPGYGIQYDSGTNEFIGLGIRVGDTKDLQGFKTKHQIRRWLKTGQQEIQGAKAGSFKDMRPGLERMLTAHFDSEGDNALALDKNGQTVTTFGDDGVERELTRADVKRMAAMVGTATADYSGTSTDGVRELRAIYENLGGSVSPDAKNAFEIASREAMDPARHAGGSVDSHGPEPETGGAS